MRAKRSSAARRMKGPAPPQAGAHLLVHDIKNLASRLSTLCQNLNERYDDPLFRRTALALLDDTVHHLGRIAADVRDRDGRVMVKLRVDVNHILEGALLDTRPDLAGEVEVVARYAALPPMWGDAFLMRRAFACAIENALAAMRGRGTLSVITSRGRGAGAPRITAEIGDTGHGMSPETLEALLERPFATSKEGGLGLGVYTMAQVAAMHGGSVRILSGEGAGTRVRFRFPALEE